jgi:hypothetical protein
MATFFFFASTAASWGAFLFLFVASAILGSFVFLQRRM